MKIDEIEAHREHIKLLVKDLRPEDEREIISKTGTDDLEKTLLKGFTMTDYCR